VSAHASRFAAHLAALVSGALAVVFALTLRPGVSAWIVLGLGAVTTLSALSAFAVADPGGTARIVEVLLALTGAWTIVASRVFSDPHATRWLCFADGVAIWALGGLGLVIHEYLIEGHLGQMAERERYRRALIRSPAPSQSPFDRAGL
jgi:hypothetical protein